MKLSSDFDWHDGKAESNLIKHKVSFQSAMGVFLDPFHVVVPTVRADDGEDRHKVIGMIEGKLHAVVFTMRGKVCWLISARRTNAKEDRIYGPI